MKSPAGGTRPARVPAAGATASGGVSTGTANKPGFARRATWRSSSARQTGRMSTSLLPRLRHSALPRATSRRADGRADPDLARLTLTRLTLGGLGAPAVGGGIAVARPAAGPAPQPLPTPTARIAWSRRRMPRRRLATGPAGGSRRRGGSALPAAATGTWCRFSLRLPAPLSAAWTQLDIEANDDPVANLHSGAAAGRAGPSPSSPPPRPGCG